MSLVTKMAEVAKECGFAEFDSTNSHQKYGYASAASVIRMVNKSLTARGIAVSVDSTLLHYFPAPEKGQATTAVVKIGLEFTDGESKIRTEGTSEGKDHGDKAINKANTGAYKYALAHALTMAWGAEDPEGDPTTDAAAGVPAKEKKPAAKRKKAEPESDVKVPVPADFENAKTPDELLALRQAASASKDKMKPEELKACVEAYKAAEARLNGGK